jgi:hypothetical protein
LPAFYERISDQGTYHLLFFFNTSLQLAKQGPAEVVLYVGLQFCAETAAARVESATSVSERIFFCRVKKKKVSEMIFFIGCKVLHQINSLKLSLPSQRILKRNGLNRIGYH